MCFKALLRKAMNGSKWSCYRCTYHNEPVLMACAMCEAPQLNQPPQTSAKTSPTPPKATASVSSWPCPMCTFANGAQLESCEMCGADKPTSTANSNFYANSSDHSATSSKRQSPTPVAPIRKKRLSSASSIGAWTCTACSASNVGSALRCEMCLSSKNRTTQTVINSQPIAQTRADDAKTGSNIYEEITNFCRVNKESFVDDSFPPTDRSIGDLAAADADDREYIRMNVKQLKFMWLRPEKLYTPEGRQYRWAVFRDPKPTDILQGAVGNCWLVSSLAVLAERPDLLSHIMITQQYNHLGIYQVRLCVYGSWRTVIIDDLLPSRTDTHTLAFSQATKNQLWVSLIEKACAKVYGSYAALIAGRSLEGLALLTGAPCESLSLEQSADSDNARDREETFTMDVIWAKLLSCREAGFLMSCSCASGARDISEVECDRVGLLSKHAYSLLDVQHVEGIKLVRLRNPWGHHTWKGPYSNKSDLWTPNLRQLLKVPVNPKEDGSFWMPFEDFTAFFDTVDISKVRSDWHELRVAVPLGTFNRTCHSLIITETTELDLTVYQDQFRAMQKEDGRGELDLCVMLFKQSDSLHGVGDLVACSRRRICAFVSTSAILRPGHYQLVLCTFNHFDTKSTANVDCMLAVHSSRPCAINVMSASSTLITDSLIQMAVANAKRHAQMGVTTYYLSAGFAGLLVVVENQSEDSGVLCVCNCTESSNVVSTREVLRTADIIPPLHRQIVMLLTQLEITANYFVSHQVSHMRQPNRLNTLGSQAVTDVGARASHEPAITHPLHTPRPMFQI